MQVIQVSEEVKDIAVIGRQRFCIGFQLAGVQHVYETDEDGFGSVLNDALEADHGIVVVPDDLFRSINRKKRETLQNSVDPVVVSLSEEGESQGLRNRVKQALGVDIWAEDN